MLLRKIYYLCNIEQNIKFKIMYQIEIEIQDSIYIVLYQYLQGEAPTYDYPGSPDEVTIFEVYEDDSENIVTDIPWSTLEELTERIEQYHLDNF